MANRRLTRKQVVIGAAPILAAGPLAQLAVGGGHAGRAAHAEDAGHQGHADGEPMLTHAAMIGDQVPAPGGPNALDALTYPPPALPHSPGRVREYTLTAIDRVIEVASGVHFAAWTYNGTVPGPVIRATQDDLLRVRFVNAGAHPHT